LREGVVKLMKIGFFEIFEKFIVWRSKPTPFQLARPKTMEIFQKDKKYDLRSFAIHSMAW
jgi:hypothetical protein